MVIVVCLIPRAICRDKISAEPSLKQLLGNTSEATCRMVRCCALFLVLNLDHAGV